MHCEDLAFISCPQTYMFKAAKANIQSQIIECQSMLQQVMESNV